MLVSVTVTLYGYLANSTFLYYFNKKSYISSRTGHSDNQKQFPGPVVSKSDNIRYQ